MITVSERVAEVIAAHVEEVFALMGNGNAYFVDALTRTPVRMTAVRHETATVAAADAYHRVSRKLACATTTYGPGYTNTLTSLGEAAQSRTPLVLVVGDAPSTGPRPWDIDQAAMASALGVPTFSVDAATAGRTALEAIHHALASRTPVVLAIPYDMGTQPAAYEGALELPVLPAAPAPDPAMLDQAAAVIKAAKRPLVLAGRGARGAQAGLAVLADSIGALTASSAPAHGIFAGRNYDLGVSGGFASEPSGELIRRADVVLAVGTALNQFTTSFGHQFGPDATVIQIDLADAPTNPCVDLFIHADAEAAVQGLAERLPGGALNQHWDGTAEHAAGSQLHFERHPGLGKAPDGRLDPRSVMRRLNEIIPSERQVASDGGHFIGWANTYFDQERPDGITLVGTIFQSIGLGLPSAVGAAIARPDATTVAVVGDGGGLMGLPDLDSLIRVASSAIVLVFNDGAYGAEVHQYGSQGLSDRIMQIPEVDFSCIAAGFGAESAVIRTLADLTHVEKWVADGARGTFLADLRISQEIIAPYITEIIELTLKK